MKRKKLFLLASLLIFQFVFSPSYVIADDNKFELNDDLLVDKLDIEEAPVNPAFNRLLSSSTPTKNYGSNEDPFKVNTNYDLFNKKDEHQKLMASNIPAYFDLRQYNRVTPVKDQGPNGSCWAFATYGSAESVLAKSEYTDFSEKHLRNTHGFDWGPDDGGTRAVAAAYLSRWSGPIWEKDDPYSPYGFTSPYNLYPAKELKEALYIPDVNNNQDMDRLKRAIMQYGASYTTVNADTRYTNFYTMSHYNPGNGWQNHAVTIIGWDDNYSRSNFGITPPGDGAWIVKNSWGNRWGSQGGYYHVSYYDAHIARGNCIFVLKDKERDKSVWYYDYLGMTDSLGYGTTGWFSNVFGPAKTTSQIGEVGFFVPSNGASYEVYVNTNIGGNSGFNDKVLVARGTVENAGYTTVKFNPRKINRGAYFAPIVKLTTPGYRYPIPVETAIYGYSSRARGGSNESYISYDGYNWSDLANNKANANVCLKAFTKPFNGGYEPDPEPDQPEPNVPDEPDEDISVNKIEVSKTNIRLYAGESTKIQAKAYPENATNKDLVWQSSNSNIASVDNSGNVKAINQGQCYITVKSAENPRILKNISVTILEPEDPIIDENDNSEVKVQSIVMYPSYKKIKVNDTFRIDTRVFPSNVSNNKLSWESEDDSIATVENGLVTAKQSGKVKIYAKSTDGSDVSNFTLLDIEGGDDNKVSSINLDCKAYKDTIFYGNSNNLSVKATDANGNGIKNLAVKFTITTPSKSVIENETTTNYRGQAFYNLKPEQLKEIGTYNINVLATSSDGKTSEENFSFELKDNRASFDTSIKCSKNEIKSNEMATITVNCKTKNSRISSANVKLIITDENGKKFEKNLRTDYYGNAVCTFNPKNVTGKYYIAVIASKSGFKDSTANDTIIVTDSSTPAPKTVVNLKFESDKQSYNTTDTANITIFATDEKGNKLPNLKLPIKITATNGFNTSLTKTTDANGTCKMFIQQSNKDLENDYTIEVNPNNDSKNVFKFKVSFRKPESELGISSPVFGIQNLYNRPSKYPVHNFLYNLR